MKRSGSSQEFTRISILSILLTFASLPSTYASRGLQNGVAREFWGTYSTTQENCEQDPGSGVFTLEVSRSDLSWWEIDCHLEKLTRSERGYTATAACVKGGGVEGRGRIDLTLPNPNTILLRSFAFKFMSYEEGELFFRCPKKQ